MPPPDDLKPPEVPPVAAPVEAAPVVVPPAEVAPPAEVPPAPAVEAAPVAEAAPVVEPEKPAAEPPPARPDLLKDAAAEEKPVEEKPAAEEKPAEPPKEGEPPKVEEKKPGEEPPPEKKEGEPVEAAAPVVEKVEYKYELPETIQIDDARRGEFHEALDGFRADPAAGAQRLIDLHNTAMTEYATRVAQDQQDSWNKTLDGWRTQTMADEQVGGAGWKTVERRGAMLRDQYVSRHKQGTPEWKTDIDSFNHMLDSTGAGNHPAMWRFLDNLSSRLLERGAPQVIDPKPAPQPKRGSEALYTHDRSPGNGRA